MASFLGVLRVLLLSLFVSVAVAADDDVSTGGGKCQNPKVRREWRKLSAEEQGEWIKALNCVGKLPHTPALVPVVPNNVSLIPPINPDSSYYDDLVYLHMDLNTKIHFDGLFLPWHRYYVHHLEETMINRCKYTGVMPYWDWTIDAHDVYNSEFFDKSDHGVGGWGDPKNDFQIDSGGFKDEIRVYPNPHHIRRNYSLYPFSNPDTLPPWGNAPDSPPRQTTLAINGSMLKSNVDGLIANYTGNYFAFQAYFESVNGAHVGAHTIVGGDMTGLCSNGATAPACIPGPKWTPNDPLFFLHHAMVDKIWHDWQNRDVRNKLAFGGGSSQATATFAQFIQFPNGLGPYVGYDTPIPSDGLWNATIWDVMDTKAGVLCYTYA